MSSARAAGARSPGKTIAMVVLVIIALLAIIAGVIYLIEPAKSLPGVLQPITSPPSRANTDRPLRGAGALIVGVLCLAGAWFTSRGGSRRG
jgi:Na+/H+ antiporter NhaD/arsenite permease-like protein